MQTRFFDASLLSATQDPLAFISSILESSTEYSIVATDAEGGILLWNEGARRLYGYEPEEVIGRERFVDELEAFLPPEKRHGHDPHR
jgi:PAS domain S-box-containing protein